MSKKRRNGYSRKTEIDTLTMALTLNGKAIEEGPKRKSWSYHDIKTIKPLTPTQEEMFQSWYSVQHLVAHGSAGTGKTFISTYLAIQDVLSKIQQKIIIIRSAVPTRNVGFLPGSLEEKVAMYEQPYQDILFELIGKPSTYQDMKAAGTIEFMTTSFIRGLTWDNAIIIVEEFQNMSFHEINSVLTRVGQNSRIILAGDISQTDLFNDNGAQKTMNILCKMKEFDCVKFTEHDIVRSDFVKSWITAVNSYEQAA